MKVKFNVQKKGVNTLKEKFELHSNVDLKKTYMVIGSMKDTGFDIIEEFLIDLKARKYFLVGIDKKNTTRRMLEELCRYTKNVYIYNNNQDDELDASVYVFEYAKKAVIYITSGSLSLSSFETDTSYYTEVIFDLENTEDKIEYKEFVDGIVKESKDEAFTQIDKAYVAKLVEEKEIFSTKQYTHNVLSISELLEKSGKSPLEIMDDPEEAPKSMPKIDLDAIEFTTEIDIGDVEEKLELKTDEVVSEESEEDDVLDESSNDLEEEKYEISDEVIDMESMLFEKANIKLEKNSKAQQKGNEESKSRKVDLENVSNLFLELPAKTAKDSEQLKVPNYIKDLIENFFEGLNKQKLSENEFGASQRKQKIIAEIIDVNSDTKYNDNEASITEVQGKTYISFNTDKLKNIYYEEKDIARIIKLSSDTYHIEIIPKTTEEYNVWKKLCTTSMRGSDRCYGVM